MTTQPGPSVSSDETAQQWSEERDSQNRRQCLTCGKWQWPFLHSCSGVKPQPGGSARPAGLDDQDVLFEAAAILRRKFPDYPLADDVTTAAFDERPDAWRIQAADDAQLENADELDPSYVQGWRDALDAVRGSR